jgi:Tol biopolymer transport system component
LSPLGAGGMGEVYRARDTKLHREVALKILPEVFASNPDRLARFQREAQLLASLNHPHIAAIYGIEDSNGVRALILELVDGRTLADRIAQGPIPFEEALPIARQIAEALEAAHEQGVIHRDLKPANVKVRPDGTVKVLDFGLAKLAQASGPGLDGSDAQAASSPTATSPAMTEMGMILGTAAYMSPEQAKGLAADKRSDVWAFGCVLYEMLTGRRAFRGDDVPDTLAAVLRGQPDWTRLPVDTPRAVARLLRRCLEKDRKARLHDIGDARIELEGVRTEPEPADLTRAPAGARSRERWAWVIAAVSLTAAVALTVPATRHLRETPPSAAPEMRLEITTPPTTDPASFAISPDGQRLVFVASDDGQSRLWLRSLDAVAAQPLAGTEGALSPFWSPDSRSVGFFDGNRLKRADIGGGLPQTLANVSGIGRGGAWSPDGSILFAPIAGSPLFRLPASGGEAVAVTKLAPLQIGHRYPQFLPGGRQFLFYAGGPPETRGIYLGSLDAPETRRLTAADTAGLYAPPRPGDAEAFDETGWLFFVRQGTLVARRFDPAREELTDDPVTVADAVGFDTAVNRGAFSVSGTGVVTYRAGAAAGFLSGSRQLTWFDRSGKALGTLGPPDENNLLFPRLSPDGRRVAVNRTVQGNGDIWLLDGVRTTRFTFDPSIDRNPTWSPDGRRIVFDSNRTGSRKLYQRLASGAGSDELLFESPVGGTPAGWTADERFLLYAVFNDPNTRSAYDLWVLPLEGDRKPFAFVNASFEERSGQFSPDGRWVTYTSNESGVDEIYVRPFPGQVSAGAQWQVSTGGGIYSRWSPDGKELFYIAPDGKMMAVPIAVNGAALEAGVPVALFETRIVGGGRNISVGRQYDVAADGRFLINVTTDDAVASPITVILNWQGDRSAPDPR